MILMLDVNLILTSKKIKDNTEEITGEIAEEITEKVVEETKDVQVVETKKDDAKKSNLSNSISIKTGSSTFYLDENYYTPYTLEKHAKRLERNN